MLYSCAKERADNVGDLRGEEIFVVRVLLIGSDYFWLGCWWEAKARLRTVLTIGVGAGWECGGW